MTPEQQALFDHARASLPRWLTRGPRAALEWLYAFAASIGASQEQAAEWLAATYLGDATGKYLDQHARDRGTLRRENEPDDVLRERIRQIEDAVTEPAIIAGVNAILAGAGLPEEAALVNLRRDRGHYHEVGDSLAFYTRGYRMTNVDRPWTYTIILPAGATEVTRAAVSEYLRQYGPAGYLYTVELPNTSTPLALAEASTGLTFELFWYAAAGLDDLVTGEPLVPENGAVITTAFGLNPAYGSSFAYGLNGGQNHAFRVTDAALGGIASTSMAFVIAFAQLDNTADGAFCGKQDGTNEGWNLLNVGSTRLLRSIVREQGGATQQVDLTSVSTTLRDLRVVLGTFDLDALEYRWGSDLENGPTITLTGARIDPPAIPVRIGDSRLLGSVLPSTPSRTVLFGTVRGVQAEAISNPSAVAAALRASLVA
jgi:hypothetical protein